MECVTACPTKKSSLVTTLGGKVVKIGIVVAIGFAIYLGAAAIGQATGMLRFTAQSLQEKAATGALKVEDIKGSSTYAAVAASYGVELERLYREAGIDPKVVPPETMLKDTGKLAGIAGFEADTVRKAVARILGIPYAGEGGATTPATPGTAVPSASPAAIPAAPTTTQPAAAAPAKPAVPTPQAVLATAKPAGAEQGALVVPADFVLEGTMSINDIAKALNASIAAIIAKLGLPADIAVDKPLRDMKDQYGY